jgi:imidazolonepropionase-like amidohydrolase
VLNYCHLFMRRYLAMFGVVALSSASPSAAPVATAIVGARLIDGTGASPVPDSVVIVDGDRIAAAGPRASVRIPRDATIVDAAGKTLIPGLVDVHCHINQPADAMRRYYEHPEILEMPRLQEALYPRGRHMLADPERKAQTLSALDLAQRKARLRAQTFPFIKAMVEGGVRVVTGTDCGAETSQVTPFGHATHREIQLFVEAGLAPLDAIRAATLDAARVITRSEDPEYGAIRAGKAADLVLLAADPTLDINNTITIHRVMRAGRWVQ